MNSKSETSLREKESIIKLTVISSGSQRMLALLFKMAGETFQHGIDNQRRNDLSELGVERKLNIFRVKNVDILGDVACEFNNTIHKRTRFVFPVKENHACAGFNKFQCAMEELRSVNLTLS